MADDEDAIVAEVRALSPLHDFVFTTGGVGPTHDDVTMKGMGQVFFSTLRHILKLSPRVIYIA